MPLAQSILALLIGFSPLAGASLFDDMPRVDSGIEGSIKMIAINPDRNEAFVKVLVSRGAEARQETFRICSVGAGDASENLLNQQMIEVLREAFQRNQRVQLKFNSIFDHCVSEVVQNSKQARGS